MGNTAQHCRLGLLQDSDFAGDLEDSKSTSGGVLFIFGSRTFVQVSWMCKKQTSVSHSSTESEIISLDAGQRMDGLLALDIWDIAFEVLRTTKDNIQPGHTNSGKLGQIQPNHTGSGKLEYVQPNSTVCDSRTKTHRVNRTQGVDQFNEVDCVPTNARSSQGKSQLYIFEDNEAVIKMIILGRSPTMRHVSRTHRVALDWLFDRINLNSKIQIKHVDTKNQFADVLTKSKFPEKRVESLSVFLQHHVLFDKFWQYIEKFFSTSLESAL